MVIVVRLVDALDRARADALAHATEARRLFELSELLVEDRSVADLVETIVVTVRSVFGTRGVALLLPVDDRLEVVASSGDPFPEADLGALASSSGCRSISGPTCRVATTSCVPSPSSTPGQSGRSARPSRVSRGERHDRELLMTFANHMAIALERAQLRQTALHVGTAPRGRQAAAVAR